jgi:light-regulated signal transduction histidine kinase (bacteriophytochrome)
LQEPLRKIQAFGERLQVKHGNTLNEEAQDYIDRMRSSAGRMQILINDLLSYSRVTTKGRPFVSVPLNQVVAQAISDLDQRIQDTRGNIEVGPLPIIKADPVQMQQLFQNLIGNALKFHKPDSLPMVKIYKLPSKRGSSWVSIYVEDNGIGFDEKYLDRIFTPFQRLHNRSEYEGSGIGLAICRKIVDRHNGLLTAKSKPGEGSTFIIDLLIEQTVQERRIVL